MSADFSCATTEWAASSRKFATALGASQIDPERQGMVVGPIFVRLRQRSLDPGAKPASLSCG